MFILPAYVSAEQTPAETAESGSEEAAGHNEEIKNPNIEPVIIPEADNPEKSVPEAGPASDNASAPENKKAVLPPGIPGLPPGVTFTEEQIKDFFANKKKSEEDYIILNFDNAGLKDVISTISTITEKSFILSPGLDARITIHSAEKIPTSEILDVFESVLEVNGMGLVKSGRFYKVIPSSTAKQKPLEFFTGKDAGNIPYTDRFITQIIQVDFVPAAEVTAVLQPMVSQFGSITPNPRNNLLIINDTAANIKRITGILKEIDQDAFRNTRMGFFQPKYADVKTIAEELTEIINVLNLGRDGTVALVPIERINSLIVFASTPNLLRSVEGWFKKLDEEITSGQSIFVYNVQNVKAESIADILKTVYAQEGSSPIRTATAQRTAAAKTRQKPAQQPAFSLGGSASSSRVEIVIFEPSNALVVLAPPGIYREIVETIKRLDVYPMEVLIEVIIAEVSLSDDEQFGIQWSALHSVHIESDPDFTGLGQSTSTLGPSLSSTMPALAGGASSGISYLLFKPERLTAMIHALASKGKVNILSSPRLLVRNHEEASIEVGEDIPTATSTTSTTDVNTLTQNIEYKTVGVKLKIKPSINDEKTVVLDIEQEVSDRLQNITVGAEGITYPSFSTRTTKTSVVVPNKQAIVIGGIIKEKIDKSYQGIPLLSSIPLLGNLFRYTVDTKSKTELVILLTPHVISNRMEADILTTDFLRKLDEVKKFLQQNESQLTISIPEEITPAEDNEQ